jgi:TIGR03009 family protein
MRRVGLLLFVFPMSVTFALAQGVPTPPAGAPVVPMNLGNPAALPGATRPLAVPAAAVELPPRLLAHLQAWEAKNKMVVGLKTEFEMTRKNTVRSKSTAFTGEVRCLKPNYARMDMTNSANKSDWNTTICDGRYVYDYVASASKMTQHAVPQGGKGGVGDNLLLEFMSGYMTVEDIKTRFDVTLDKEEDFYIHLKIKPKMEKDRQEFDKLTLVLYSSKLAERKWDYLPALAVISKNADEEVEQWAFKNPVVNPQQMSREMFAAVPVPKGWTTEQGASMAPRTPPARPIK